MDRRRFLLSSLGLIAAPAIVRADSLMAIHPFDPEWIVNHANHPIFGELVVRLPNTRNLSQFNGLIQPGQFFWRQGDRLLDLCQWSKTRLDVTPGMISIRNLGRDHESTYVNMWGDHALDISPGTSLKIYSNSKPGRISMIEAYANKPVGS